MPLTCADGLALGRYDDNVLVHLDAVFVSEDTWQHDLCPVTDGVDLRTQIQVIRLLTNVYSGNS